MMNAKTAAALLALMMAVPAAGMAEDTGALAVLGVQVKDTPAPTETASPTPAPSPAPEVMREATLSEALSEAITQEEMDAAGLGERILIRGMEGEDVAIVQRRLYQLGYYLGDIDGIFGLATRTAVYGFQRAHKLAKVDGKAGPETIGRLFSDDVVIKPTPTPSPTPPPSPTPTPSSTPEPTPVVTPTPDAALAPFAMESVKVYIGERQTELMFGRDEAGALLYPMCGVMEWLGYESTYAAGSWQLVREQDGREAALMTDGQDGLCRTAMGSADGVIFLADEESRVYVYGTEAYLTEAMLRQLGLSVVLVGDTPVIN